MPNTSNVLISTVETLVIPPFFAAVLIDASAPKLNILKNTSADCIPTLDPIGLDVAATGSVIEQEDSVVRDAATSTNVTSFFMMMIKFG